MKPFLFILLLGSLGTVSAAPSITIADQQTPPLSSRPNGANNQPPHGGAREHGPLSTLPLGPVAGMNVTWADPNRFPDPDSIRAFLNNLLTDSQETNWSYHAWSYGDSQPSLIATIDYGAGKTGEWWIWKKPNLAWAIQDENGRWWFGMWNASGKKSVTFPAPALTVMSALVAVEKGEQGEQQPTPEVTDYLATHGAHDPAVIAYFRKALAERGPVALRDLALMRGEIWDDSFLEPVLHLVEASAILCGKGSNADATASYDYACQVINHQPKIRDDPAVTHRLSQVILTIWPDLADPATPANPARMQDQLFSTALMELAQSRDRSVVPILRRYLKVSELDGNGFCTSSPEGLVFARVCDHARCEIHALLGIAPKRTDPLAIANAMIVKPGYHPALWSEWARENAELDRRLEGFRR